MLLCKTQLGESFQKAAQETETIWCFLSTLQWEGVHIAGDSRASTSGEVRT